MAELLLVRRHSRLPTMSISKALRDGAKLAVFTRNYKDHLGEAFRVSSAEPERLIPFRGVSRWSSAAQALQQHCPIDIYFAVVDSGSHVQYAAKLLRVIVDPQRGQPETEQLLDLSTPRPATKDFGRPRASQPERFMPSTTLSECHNHFP